MLILSRNFCWRADGTWFVCRVCALISHLPEIKIISPRSAMCLLTHHIDIFAPKVMFFSKIAGVWEEFSHSFLWGPPHLSLCYFSSVCIFLPLCSAAFRPFPSFFTFSISFCPLTLQLFCLFRYSSFCLFNSLKHSASCSAMKKDLFLLYLILSHPSALSLPLFD